MEKSVPLAVHETQYGFDGDWRVECYKIVRTKHCPSGTFEKQEPFMVRKVGHPGDRTVQANGLLYIERQADEELLRQCRSGGFAHVFSSPQMGKSSLITRTAERLIVEGIRPVILDLSQLGEQASTEELFRKFLPIIEDRLDLNADVLAWWETYQHLPLSQRLPNLFRDVVLAEIADPVVIFIDAVERLENLPITAAFFEAVGSLNSARAASVIVAPAPTFTGTSPSSSILLRKTDQRILKRVSVVFVGTTQPTHLVAHQESSPLRSSHCVNVTDFSLEEALPLADGLSLSPDVAKLVLERIFKWTSGHPYLTQLLCRVIEERKQSSWSEAEVDDSVREYFSQVGRQDHHLQCVRDHLTERAPHRDQVLTLYERILRSEGSVLDDETSDEKSFLKLIGVVRSDHSALRVRNRIYEDVFSRQWVKDQLPKGPSQRSRRWGVAATVLLFLFALLGWLAKTQYELNENQHRLAEAKNKISELEKAGIQRMGQSPQETPPLVSKRAYSKEELTGIEQQAISAQEQVKLFEAELFEQKQAAEAEISQLRSDVARLEVERADNQQRLKEAREKIRGFEVAVTEQSREREDETTRLRADRARLEATLPDSQQQLVESHGRIKELEAVLAQQRQAAEAEVVRLSAAQVQLSSKLLDSQQQLEAAQQREIELETQLTDTLRQVAEQEERMRPIHAASSQQERAATVEVDTLAAARVQLESELTNSQKEAIEAHEQVRNLKVAIAEQEHIAKDNISRLTADRETLTAKLIDTQRELANVRNSMKQLQAEVKELRLSQKSTGSRKKDSSLGEDLAKEASAGHVMLADRKSIHPLLVSRIRELTNEAIDHRKRTGPDDLSLLFARQAYLLSQGGVGQMRAQVDKALRIVLDPAPLKLSGHKSRVNAVAYNPSGHFLASGSGDRTIRLWNLAQPKPSSKVFEGHAASVTAVSFSPDGRILASASSDATIRLWNLSNPSASSTVLQGHMKGVNAVAFSPGGLWLASAGKDFTVRLWDMKQPGLMTETLQGHSGWVNSVAFGPDGWMLASASDDLTIRLWDLRFPSAAPIVLVGHQKGVTAVAFSRDGRMLASGSSDHTVRLWDLNQSVDASVVLQGHNGSVSWVAFSPEGRTLASGGDDTTIRLWDLESPGSPSVVLRGHRSKVTSVVFSPDGSGLASGSLDKSVRTWATTKALAQLVCHRVQRNLSLQEWNTMGLTDLPYERTCPNHPVHPTFLEEGKKLAKRGAVAQATAIFQRAIELDPYLNLNPRAEVERLAANGP